MQGGLSGQKERSGTGDVATRGGVARGRPNTGGAVLAAVWACAEGDGAGRVLVGVQALRGAGSLRRMGPCLASAPREARGCLVIQQVAAFQL